MKNIIESRDTKKVAVKTEEILPAEVVTSDKGLNPIIKAKDEIKETYNSHIKAQKNFENAFKELNKKDQEAYEDFKKKYQAYEEAIQKAFKLRESAEQEALTAYQGAIEKTGEDYRNAMKSALLRCKEATEEARKELLGMFEVEPDSPVAPQPLQEFSRAATKSLNVALLKVSQGLTSVKNSIMN
jgi:F0F1-type ATP synthase membrane subunit b/b'